MRNWGDLGSLFMSRKGLGEKASQIGSKLDSICKTGGLNFLISYGVETEAEAATKGGGPAGLGLVGRPAWGVFGPPGLGFPLGRSLVNFKPPLVQLS